MSGQLPESGQTAALMVVGLMVLSIPVGLSLVHGLSTPTTDHTVIPTVTPPSLLTPTPTETATPTATVTPTETPTSSPTPGGDDNGTDENRSTGQTHFVNTDGGVADNVNSDGETSCENAKYRTIQRAVAEAASGDTIVVCAGRYLESVTVETANLTLRADGEVVIETSGQPAVRTTGPHVTIRGFTLRSDQADYTVAVGGRETRIRNNTIEPGLNSTGIFFSDGLTPAGGDPDPTLGAATGSRAVENTITIGQLARYGVWTDADGTIVRANSIVGRDNVTSIRSSGNRTLVRDNTLRYPTACVQQGLQASTCNRKAKPPAMLIGNHHLGFRGNESPAHWSEDNNSTHATHNWAHENRVVNNSVSEAPGFGLMILGTGSHSEILAAVKGTVVRDNTFLDTGGIGGWTNGGVYQNNTIDVDSAFTGEVTQADRGAQSGGGEQGLGFHAHDARIIGNYIEGYTGAGLSISGRNTVIRSNTVTNSTPGLLVGENDHQTEAIRVVNNTVTDAAATGFEAARVAQGANVTQFHHNKITGNPDDGISIGGYPRTCSGSGDKTHGGSCVANVSGFHHNNISGNGRHGIVITGDATVTGFHRNVIDNNDRLGIYKQNVDSTDNYWPIVNATNNYWGCGGPSSGLQDPHTERMANGTGDAISAGDDPGISNVHFDPFFVREGLTCPSESDLGTPTPTPTPMPTGPTTPTQQPPPTSTAATSTPTPGGGGEGGTGSGGDGTGGTGGGGDAGSGPATATDSGADGRSSDSDDSGGTSTPTPSVSPTPTVTPTLTPTPTVSPTPVVEPGFGVGVWLVGIAILVGLLAGRRPGRRNGDEATHE